MSNLSKEFQELTIIDNFMFIAVMQDPENSKMFLEMLFGVPIERIEVSGETALNYHPKHRSVRLDVYIKDEDNTRYNIEMQAYNKDSIVKRTRYYHSQIDMNLISTGTKYKDLPDTFVIFICDFDPFGKKKYCYTVKNKCVEDSSIEIKDGVTSIYLSTRGENKTEVSKELVNFLDFVREKAEGSKKDYGDAFVKQLQKSIEEIKQSREWGDRYMGLKEWLEDEYDEGLEKGRSIGITEGKAIGLLEGKRLMLVSQVKKKLEKGNTLEEIADILEEDVELIRGIVEEITE